MRVRGFPRGLDLQAGRAAASAGRRTLSAASPPVRFVILAWARTGSTLLVSLLNRAGLIRCHGEIFHPNKVWFPAEPEELERLKRDRAEDPIKFMQRMYEETGGRPRVGFKLFPGHSPKVLEHVLAEESIRKIVLYRENVLAVHSSGMIARAAGRFTYGQTAHVPPKLKVEFDPAAFTQFHDRYVSHYRRVFSALGDQCCHPVEYTQLQERALVGGVAAFLDLDGDSLWKGRRAPKQNPSDILSRFTNPETVEAFLKEIGRQSWIHEGRTDWSPLAQTVAA